MINGTSIWTQHPSCWFISNVTCYWLSYRNCTDSLKASLASALRHTQHQAQSTYDKRTSSQKKQQACDFARHCAENSRQSQQQSEHEDPVCCPYKPSDFVAVVEESSTLKVPKVLIGQVLQCLNNQEVSLLWYKHFVSQNSYALTLDGNAWVENVGSLHSVKMLPWKSKPGHYKLSTSTKTLHKAVFGGSKWTVLGNIDNRLTWQRFFINNLLSVLLSIISYGVQTINFWICTNWISAS